MISKMKNMSECPKKQSPKDLRAISKLCVYVYDDGRRVGYLQELHVTSLNF